MQKSAAMNYTAHYGSPLGGITLASNGIALTGLWFEGQKHFAAKFDPQHRECDDLPVFAETKRWLDSYFSGQVPDFTPKLAMRATPFRQAIWEILLTIPYGKTVTYGEIARRFVVTFHETSLQSSSLHNASLHGATSLDTLSRNASLQVTMPQDTSSQDALSQCSLLQGMSIQGAMLAKKNMSAQAVGGAVGHNPIAIIIPCHRVIGANGSLTGYAGGVERKKYLLELERGKTNSL